MWDFLLNSRMIENNSQRIFGRTFFYENTTNSLPADIRLPTDKQKLSPSNAFFLSS